jgi:2-C-methyl-D-erythritol 2,4-cyclodiphosphate synthase
MRIGYGWDSHEFKRRIRLKLGGVEVPHTKGLAGHSDGDVLLHALTDALLGAVAAGDIGTFFPPSSAKWKNAASSVFLRDALRRVRRAGYRVVNADATLILGQPQIAPYAAKIRANVAKLLGVAPSAVGVKAKTPEGMGTEKAAIAHAVVLLEKARVARRARERR